LDLDLENFLMGLRTARQDREIDVRLPVVRRSTV
jgi:hypothetical protein